MAKITRMTVRTIESLRASSGLEKLGKGNIRTGIFLLDTLTVEYPFVTLEFEIKRRFTNLNNQDFLGAVDKILEDKKLYLSEVIYRPQTCDGFIPHKLEGIFYSEK